MRTHIRRLAVGLLVGLGLVACTAGSDTADAPTATAAPTAPVAPSPSDSPSDSPPPSDPLAAASRSVVALQGGQAQGSGVVVDTDGHILAASAVVGSSAGERLTVTFSDGATGDAEAVGTDPLTGLVVIRVDGQPDLPTVVFADSDDTEVDDEVALLQPSSGEAESTGTVRATSRVAGATTMLEAAVPGGAGNAGGPLVNPEGEVVGILMATASQGDVELSLAIPSNVASRVADQLIADGAVVHPYLGTSVDDGPGGGALVQDVITGSPAEQAGLQPGDVITRVGDRSVEGAGDVVYGVQSRSPGDDLSVAYTRDGTDQDITVTLGEAPAE